MSRSFERLRLLQLQAARAQVRLDELRALSTPSQEAYERAEARVQKEVAQRATRKVSSTPRRRLEQLDRMAELKRAALSRSSNACVTGWRPRGRTKRCNGWLARSKASSSSIAA